VPSLATADELRCKGRRLLVLLVKSLSQEPPMVRYLHGDGPSCGSQRDFKFHFPGVGVDAAVVRLTCARRRVESVSDVDVDIFVLGVWYDAVFTAKRMPPLNPSE